MATRFEEHLPICIIPTQPHTLLYNTYSDLVVLNARSHNAAESEVDVGLVIEMADRWLPQVKDDNLLSLAG